MAAKVIEFPKNRKFNKIDTESKEKSLFLKTEKKVKRIYEIKREEEREDQMFPPNYLTLITLGKPN